MNSSHPTFVCRKPISIYYALASHSPEESYDSTALMTLFFIERWCLFNICSKGLCQWGGRVRPPRQEVVTFCVVGHHLATARNCHTFTNVAQPRLLKESWKFSHGKCSLEKKSHIFIFRLPKPSAENQTSSIVSFCLSTSFRILISRAGKNATAGYFDVM